MVVKVDESSEYPYYLAVQFLYQGGQMDIVIVDVAQVNLSMNIHRGCSSGKLIDNIYL